MIIWLLGWTHIHTFPFLDAINFLDELNSSSQRHTHDQCQMLNFYQLQCFAIDQLCVEIILKSVSNWLRNEFYDVNYFPRFHALIFVRIFGIVDSLSVNKHRWLAVESRRIVWIVDVVWVWIIRYLGRPDVVIVEIFRFIYRIIARRLTVNVGGISTIYRTANVELTIVRSGLLSINPSQTMFEIYIKILISVMIVSCSTNLAGSACWLFEYTGMLPDMFISGRFWIYIFHYQNEKKGTGQFLTNT